MRGFNLAIPQAPLYIVCNAETLQRAQGIFDMPSKKERIDSLLVRLGLAESRHKAQAMLMAGVVTVDGRMVEKAGTTVPSTAEIRVKQAPQFVGRGGTKMQHALDSFELDVSGSVALDVGASTGGFTDCLLQNGASRVYAVDVGRGQIHQRLRDDPRVMLMEGINARLPFHLPEKVGVATVDVSFISLVLVLPEVVRHVEPGGSILGLVKPHFEAGRREVGKGGVVRDPKTHAATISKVALWAIGHGLRFRGATASPILGNAGNREFFVWLQKPGST